MKELRFSLVAFALAALFGQTTALAQCDTWTGKPFEEEATNAHVLYRGIVNGKTVADLEQLSAEEFNIAYENWKKAYDMAPAADGQRPSHYSDGRDLLKVLYNKSSDAEEKKQLGEQIMDLYAQEIECYKNEAFLLGRKGYDMFYMPEYGYRQATYDALKAALDKGGKEAEYILLEPMAQVLVYFFKTNKVGQEEAQQMYTKLEEVAEHNIANNSTYGEYYEAAKARMDSHFKEIEDQVFDCGYFRKKLMPQYEENPNDLEVVKYVYVKLRQQGCDTTETFMIDLRTNYEQMAKIINDSLELVRRERNPCYDATQLQKEGDYDLALSRYQECLNADSEMDDEGRAQIYYSIASIQLYRKNNAGAALSAARKAASLRSGWGRPYLLIGDSYAKLGRNCDDWTSRLAILAAMEKYRYAKSVDGDVAEDADKRLGQYYDAMPARQDGFMRGVKEGQSVSVGCGIGESVTVRFKD